jgi:metallophosphoesterase superfamily enzyme
MRAAPAAATYALADGVVALSPGVAWLPASRAIVAADAHLAYEEVIGAALPLWSTDEIVATLSAVARSAGAREIIFLGDIVHGPRMSEGAMRAVRAALDRLREEAAVTLVAGNHEGRSRAFAVLGETVEFAERDGRLLVHGDGPAELGRPTMIGHLHPSLRLGGGATAPAFVGCQALVVLPALNPYSPGLDVASDAFAAAIGLWNVRREDVQVVACAGELLYPFGSLSHLREGMREPTIRRADRA